MAVAGMTGRSTASRSWTGCTGRRLRLQHTRPPSIDAEQTSTPPRRRVQDFKTSLCSLPSERPASLMTCGQAPRAALSGSTEVSTDFLIRNLKVGPTNDALPIGSTQTDTELQQRGFDARALVGGITAWHAIGGTTVPLDTSTYDDG
jgi:hypothetical protein